MADTRVQVILEGQNRAANEIAAVNRHIAGLGQTAATTNAQLSPVNQALGNKLPQGAKDSAAAMARLGQSVAATNQGMNAFRQLGTAIGFQVAPRITSAILGASGAMNALRMASGATGVGLRALGPAALIASVGIAATVKSVMDWADARRLAAESGEAWATQAKEQGKDVAEEIRILNNQGLLTPKILSQLYVPLLAGNSTLALKKLREFKAAMAVGDDGGVTLMHRQLQAETLSGFERERALVDILAHKQLNEIEQLDRKVKLTKEQADELRSMVHLVADINLAQIDKSEFEMVSKAVAAMSQGQQQAAQLVGAGVADRLQRTAVDPQSTPAQVAGAETKLEEEAFNQRLAQLDELAVTDEEYWMAREELTAQHLANIADIQKREHDAEKARQRDRIDGVGQMFGAMAQLAAQFGQEGFVAYKALAIGEAIIATYLGASKALGDGDSYSAAFRAAAIIAMGLANVATIAAQQPPGYATGGWVDGAYNGQDDRVIRVGPGEVILNPRQVQMLGSEEVYNVLSLTGGKLPSNFTARPAEIVPFASGGMAAVAPPASTQPIEVRLRSSRDRQDSRDWESRRSRKALIQDLRREGKW